MDRNEYTPAELLDAEFDRQAHLRAERDPGLPRHECLEWRGPKSGCEGPVEYHSTDPGYRSAFPRCEKHWLERLDREEEYRQFDTPVAPSWFDPSYAGERWDEDD
jgi:hypothetical protein